MAVNKIETVVAKEGESLAKLGLYATKMSLPSFVDGKIETEHTYDEKLSEFFNRLKLHEANRFDLSRHNATFNPLPNDEANVFSELDKVSRLNMYIRNNLFLSRLFIHNAKKMNLFLPFVGLEKIRILDLGCGLAHSLMGIMAFFGEERIDYLGVDISAKDIEECKHAYGDFPYLTFQVDDGLKLLSNPEYAKHFDLVLIQHPDFTNPGQHATFSNIFLNTKKVIAEGGILYSTFYYTNEKQYFAEKVLPHLREFGECQLKQSDACKDSLKPRVPYSGTPFLPENYVLISPPFRHELLLTANQETEKSYNLKPF